MEDTRAISPEIIGLFNKVQSQAEDYGKAFDLLEKHRKEFDVAINKIRELEENIRKESKIAISQINTNVLESLILLKNRTEDTVKLSIDLGDIKAFKESLVTLKDDLNTLLSKVTRQSEDVESTLKYFKKKSEMELESTLLGLKSKIDKEVQSEAQKIELRYNLKLKQLENIFISFDERIKLLEGSSSSAFKKLSLELDLIKHGYNFDNESSGGYIINENTGTDTSGRLSALEIMMNSINEKIDDMAAPLVPPPSNVSDERIEEFGKRVNQLSGKLAEISNQLDSRQKSGASMAVSLAAIVIALIAVAAALL